MLEECVESRRGFACIFFYFSSQNDDCCFIFCKSEGLDSCKAARVVDVVRNELDGSGDLHVMFCSEKCPSSQHKAYHYEVHQKK